MSSIVVDRTEERAEGAVEARRRPLPGKLYAGGAIVGFVILVAIIGPFLLSASPTTQHIADRLQPAGAHHLLGTDELGRDALSRLLTAARIDIGLGVVLTLIPAIAGTLIGAVAGYFGRWTDMLAMRTADVVQAFPAYVLIIALAFALGAGVRSIIIAFAIVAWVPYARLVRSEVLRIRSADYVLAAEGAGLPRLRVFRRHVLPNVLNQAVVLVATEIVFAILTLASFSYLGLGLSPSTPEWGLMIANGQNYLQTHWLLSGAPAIALIVTGLGFLLIGDSLDDMLRKREGE